MAIEAHDITKRFGDYTALDDGARVYVRPSRTQTFAA